MITRAVIAGAALVPLLLLFPAIGRTAPPTRAEIGQWCADAEDTSHCYLLIEAQQLRRLPGLATRNGPTLSVSLYPSGTATFTDVEDIHGGTTYALWDNLSPINAVVIAVTRDDHTTYLILMRANGRKFELPAEPVLSPDHAHLVTADICPHDCSNTIVMWRVTREGVAKASSWDPAPAWSDAAITWKDADTLSIDYTPMGASESRSQQLKLGDKIWRDANSR